jgi:hypothetical protein
VLVLVAAPVLVLVVAVALVLVRVLVLAVALVLGLVLKALVLVLVRGWVLERAPDRQTVALDARGACVQSRSATWQNTAAAAARRSRRQANTCALGAWPNVRPFPRSEHTCGNRYAAPAGHPSRCTWRSWGYTTSRAADVATQHSSRNATNAPAEWRDGAHHGMSTEDGQQGTAATPGTMRSGNGSSVWEWRLNQPAALPQLEAALLQSVGWRSRYKTW